MISIQEKVINYVALGDSLAAGTTPYGEEGKGYPDYLTKKMKATGVNIQFNNFGVYGYTSENLKKELSENYLMRESIKEATVITLNIGSNDFFYALKKDPNGSRDTLKVFTENFSAILEEIKSLNETTNVYILGYYNPFREFPEKKKKKLTRILNFVNDIIKNKAKSCNYIFVETENIITDNYDNCLPNPEDFHLSTMGYELLANKTFQTLQQNRD